MNAQGDFIWYELMSRDLASAKAFYEPLIGWRVGEKLPGDMAYYEIAVGDTCIGGVMPLTDDMCEQGARPCWLGYIAVEDVDATIDKLVQLGGQVLLPAFDIENIGRLAMVSDPLGAPFYLMRGFVDAESHAFHETTAGHCCWNELNTTDQAAAIAFYTELFGWDCEEKMSMGEMGDYVFIHQNGVQMGAISPVQQEGSFWQYYIRVDDIYATPGAIAELGGKVLHGPHEVPGDDAIVIGQDREGVVFGLVGNVKKD